MAKRPKTDPTPEEQVRVLRGAVKLAPEELRLPDLLPMFAPASFFEKGNWLGPSELLKIPGLGLTWSIAQPKQTMLYLSHSAAKHWEDSGIDWRQESMQNLDRITRPKFCTGGFAREGGKKDDWYALAFMHDDGYGPSRLLFWEELGEIFPAGYLIAIPEMSLGIALSRDATREERAEIEELVGSCYKDGTRPLIPGLHDSALLVPR